MTVMAHERPRQQAMQFPWKFTHRYWVLTCVDHGDGDYPYSVHALFATRASVHRSPRFNAPLSAVAYAVRMIDEGVWK